MTDPRWTEERASDGQAYRLAFNKRRVVTGMPWCDDLIIRHFENVPQHTRLSPPAFDALVAAVNDAARIPDLEAENERHRKANLVRAVTAGVDPEWVSDIIAADGFDAVPWKIAGHHVDILRQARQLARDAHDAMGTYDEEVADDANDALYALLLPPPIPGTPTPTGQT